MGKLKIGERNEGAPLLDAARMAVEAYHAENQEQLTEAMARLTRCVVELDKAREELRKLGEDMQHPLRRMLREGTHPHIRDRTGHGRENVVGP